MEFELAYYKFDPPLKHSEAEMLFRFLEENTAFKTVTNRSLKYLNTVAGSKINGLHGIKVNDTIYGNVTVLRTPPRTKKDSHNSMDSSGIKVIDGREFFGLTENPFDMFESLNIKKIIREEIDWVNDINPYESGDLSGLIKNKKFDITQTMSFEYVLMNYNDSCWYVIELDRKLGWIDIMVDLGEVTVSWFPTIESFGEAHWSDSEELKRMLQFAEYSEPWRRSGDPEFLHPKKAFAQQDLKNKFKEVFPEAINIWQFQL